MWEGAASVKPRYAWLISDKSHAWATFQSRITVSGETPTTSAVS